MSRLSIAISTVALVFAASIPAFAADSPHKGAIKYRQAAMTVIGGNFKPMGAMLKGKLPWDAKAFAAHARDLAAVAGIDLLRAFPEDSDEGKTKAKADIWLDWDDFLVKMKDFKTAAAMMEKAAAGGDKGAIKSAFKGLGKSCKSCHKEYKAKKE